MLEANEGLENIFENAVKEAEKVLADIRLETTQDTLSSINQHLINKRVLYRVGSINMLQVNLIRQTL